MTNINGIICMNTEIKKRHLNSMLATHSNQAHIVILMLINDRQWTKNNISVTILSIWTGRVRENQLIGNMS